MDYRDSLKNPSKTVTPRPPYNAKPTQAFSVLVKPDILYCFVN